MCFYSPDLVSVKGGQRIKSVVARRKGYQYLEVILVIGVPKSVGQQLDC